MQLIVRGYHIFLLHKTSIWTVSWREPRLTRRRSIVAVADDDPMILTSLGLLLESAGHDARPLPSATALRESSGVHETECLLSDIGMPVIDGFELARAVQAARPIGQELLKAVGEALRGLHGRTPKP